MSFDCIVSQVHIPPYDVQGSLVFDEKLKLVEYGIQHLRIFNPNSYIILTGHGHRPKSLELCDFVHWNDESEPLNEHGYVIGMPAQYKYVSIGIQHAISKGFKRCLKTRGDCIIGINNITKHCDDILNSENKIMLVTQQTGEGLMGDCFMYGDLDVLGKTWHSDNQVISPDGLQNTAHHFRMAVGSAKKWRELVKETCSFRDVDELKFTCLRWNYHKIDEYVRQAMLSSSFDFSRYHWGLANGWHSFDADRNMRSNVDYFWSRKDFYNAEFINSGR